MPDLYDKFPEGQRIPLVIVQILRLYRPAVGGASGLAIKRARWRHGFAVETLDRFPRIKMINWIEWREPTAEIDADVIDWRVTSSPSLTKAFPRDRAEGRFSFAPVPSPEVLAAGGSEDRPLSPFRFASRSANMATGTVGS